MRITDSRLDEYMRKRLKAEWEGYCTLDNAKRAREDVENIITKFHKISNIPRDILFLHRSYSSHATLMHTDKS